MNSFGLPNLPSDTLYKFLTFFGLVIFLTSFLTPIISFKDNDLNKYALTLKYRTLEHKHQELNRTIRNMDSTIEGTTFQKNNVVYEYKRLNGKSKFDSSRYFYYQSFLDKRNNLSSLANVQNDSILVLEQQLDNTYLFETQVVKYCNLGVLSGVVIALCGFILWFINNQVYQDLFIKLQGGYRIIPKKNDPNAKNYKPLSDDELYMKSWNKELTTVMLILN